MNRVLILQTYLGGEFVLCPPSLHPEIVDQPGVRVGRVFRVRWRRLAFPIHPLESM